MFDLSIIIVNYNTKDLTLGCLGSIFSSGSKVNYNVFVVDNNSNDGSSEAIKKQYPQVNLINSPNNVGFAGGNNLALRQSRARFNLLINSDTEIVGNALDSLVKFGKESDFDIISCKLIDEKGNFQPNAGELPKLCNIFYWISGIDDLLRPFILLPSYQQNNLKYYQEDKQVGWVSGSVMLINREVIDKVGLLDSNIFMYGEDVDYCLRANKSGFKIGWTSLATIIHLGGKSSSSPKYNQWLGEFKGLLYIYQKFGNVLSRLLLKLLFYIFILARMIAFALIGKFSYSKTYAKIIVKV